MENKSIFWRTVRARRGGESEESEEGARARGPGRASQGRDLAFIERRGEVAGGGKNGQRRLISAIKWRGGFLLVMGRGMGG